MIIVILIFILLICGFGGYRMGPGPGYYIGGGLGTIILILIICMLLGLIPGLK